ncbi:transposase [Streptomyces sp. NBC_01310]|nr:transposase [Streptomyces sp. NBC_01310]
MGPVRLLCQPQPVLGGLRLHLVCTLQGLPLALAPTGAKADERETLLDLLAAEPHLVSARPGQTLIGDKNHFDRDFERELAQWDTQLLRPTRKGRTAAARPIPVQAAPAGHRVGQRDLQGTAPPRTAPRSHPSRCHRPRHAAHTRADRRNPAQRPQRTNQPPLAHLVRSPTPWN